MWLEDQMWKLVRLGHDFSLGLPFPGECFWLLIISVQSVAFFNSPVTTRLFWKVLTLLMEILQMYARNWAQLAIKLVP